MNESPRGINRTDSVKGIEPLALSVFHNINPTSLPKNLIFAINEKISDWQNNIVLTNNGFIYRHPFWTSII